MFLLFYIPLKLSSQTLTPQTCSQNQSWISRWTISSVTGPSLPNLMIDGDRSTTNDCTTPGPWTFNFNFGIVRRLSEIIVYTGSTFSPHNYQVLVSQDNVTFGVAKTGSLSYTVAYNDQTIDLNGFFNAQYVRIVFSDSYSTISTYGTSRLMIPEINFIQCGVDPLIAKQITPGAVITPALTCADAVSKDIQGVINTYIPGLTDAPKGAGSVNVDMLRAKGATHTLVAGDRILIIQMQNTFISEINSMAYGDGIDNDLIASGWVDVKNTGEYEFAIVSSVSGNTIQLTQPLQKSYTATGVFQVVYSPVLDNVTLNGPIKAADWDGYCGGIVTFDARTLNLNGQNIQVNAQGFRGGKINSNGNPAVQYFWGTYCTDNNLLFGEKGEGVAGAPRGTYPTSKRLYSPESTSGGGSFARGAPGNAGGGGNDHNSGGGGGGNIGSGGQGGASWGNTASGVMTNYWNTVMPNGYAPSGSNAGFVPNGGMGGTGCGAPDPFRIWLGGGGGGGHQNDNAATGGGAGGGIILVTARKVTGTGSFLANGEDANNTIFCLTCTPSTKGNDGAGGGGAGGSIIFGFDDASAATINFSASGGVGGSVTAQDAPHGPGGGGGGGAIVLSSIPTNTTILKVDGGTNGIYVLGNSPWGANKGQQGFVTTSNQLSVLYTYSCDHGDAPVSYGDAAHQLKTNMPSLRTPGDAEPMALNQPPHDRDALGDDLTGIDDEDGVYLPFDTLTTAQSFYRIRINVQNPQNMKVNVVGWIDFNENGQFDDNEKSSITGVIVGDTALTWKSFPSDFKGGDSYARFRISTGNEALKPIGVAPDGEAEDYTIYINGIPAAVPDDTCTHQGRPVNVMVVKNDNINGDKRGKITILNPPLKGTAVVNDNGTPNNKSDDFIKYTPNPRFQGVDSLTYELWNGIGNSAKAKVTITVKEPISIDFTANPSEGCTPLSVDFSNLSNEPNANYTWNFGDNSATSNSFSPVHIFKTGDTTSVYKVKLTMNTGCCIIDTTKLITVYPLPHAIMSIKSDDERPEVVTMTDISPSDIGRTWSIDGIIRGTEPSITATFDSVGQHTIRLTVYNKYGCSDDTVMIHNTVFRNLYVPNAFIPGSSDPTVNTFKPIGYGLKEYTLMIFDLWGNLIWSDSQLNSVGQPLNGWDGKDKHGVPLPSDAYIWQIKAVLVGGKPWKGMEIPLHSGSYHTRGSITIIR